MATALLLTSYETTFVILHLKKDPQSFVTVATAEKIIAKTSLLATKGTTSEERTERKTLSKSAGTLMVMTSIFFMMILSGIIVEYHGIAARNRCN